MTRPTHDSLSQLLADLRSLGFHLPADVQGIGIQDGIVYIRTPDGTWDFTVPMFTPDPSLFDA